MNTTPTPDDMDWEVQHKSYWEVEHGEPANAIAAYRVEIEQAQAKHVEQLQVSLGKERSESQRFLQRLGETVIECNHLKERIATLEKALSEAEKFILQQPCPPRCIRDGECNCGKWRTIAAIRQAKGQA